MVKKVKIAKYALIISIVFILLFISSVLIFVPDIKSVGAEELILGAHRGNSVEYIENTMLAFKSALEDNKYKFIEFDIQYTKDKRIIVHHDDSLMRLQNKPFLLKNLDYKTLNNLSNYKIPLYEEVMDLIADKKPINIEIKSQGNLSDDCQIAEFIISDCKERGILDKILISSISSEVIQYINDNYDDIRTGKIYWVTPSTFLTMDAFTNSIYVEKQKIGADYLMLHGTNIRNFESLKRLQDDNTILVFWYFNDQMYIVNTIKDSFIKKIGLAFRWSKNNAFGGVK